MARNLVQPDAPGLHRLEDQERIAARILAEREDRAAIARAEVHEGLQDRVQELGEVVGTFPHNRLIGESDSNLKPAAL